MPVLLLITFFLTTLLKAPAVSAVHLPPIELETVVSASVGEPKLTLFGYGPPNTQVYLTAIGVFDSTLSQSSGYFEFINVYLPKASLNLEGQYSYPELCLQAADKREGVSSQPTCLPPLIADQNYYYIGPVILSPTLILDKGSFLKGEQVRAFGQTLPNSEVEIFLARQNTPGSFFNIVREAFAYYLPSYKVVSNQDGYYEFNLPADSPDNWKIFTALRNQDYTSPPSNKLGFKVLPFYHIFLDYLLLLFNVLRPYLIYIVSFVQIALILIFWQKIKQVKAQNW